MATHAAPTGTFELQRTDSLKQPRAPNFVVDDDDAATDSDVSENLPRAQSDLEDDTQDDEDIDDTVKEDMKKLEATFPGVSERFRLVNRIGEGKGSFLLGHCASFEMR